MNNFDVIIPICSSQPVSLDKCIEALIKYTNDRQHVYMINGLGEGNDSLTGMLSPFVSHPRVHYRKAPVKTCFSQCCNDALSLLNPSSDVLILSPDVILTEGCAEEMYSVLYECERNGAVSPRGYNMAYLSVPEQSNDANVTRELSYDIFKQVSPLLPKKSVIPSLLFPAVLIKREIIDRFGLFEDKYTYGGEIIDFSMKINRYGYSLVAANHAYVYCMGNDNLYINYGVCDNLRQIYGTDLDILAKRYPYYENLAQLYSTEQLSPVDYFADLIADGVYEKPRILFSLYEVPAVYNGTAMFALSIYDSFLKKYGEKYHIFLLVNSEADRFHGLSSRYTNVYTPDTLKGTFHLAFSPSQIFHTEHMIILNRTCLKYIFCMQDIISIRSRHTLVRELEREKVFGDSIRFCNMMLSISRFSLNDTRSYYSEVFSAREIPVRYIYHGTDKQYIPSEKTSFSLPFDEYFVLFGNEFAHKYILPTTEQLKSSKHNIIIIGSPEDGPLGNNIYRYRSGNLPDDFLDHVLGNSLGIIFPSLYEGFGLPFLDSMSYRKKLIVNDTELNRELRDYFNEFKENVYIFKKLEEIEDILDTVKASPDISIKDHNLHIRSWEDCADELEECIRLTLDTPVDTRLLSERWNYYNYLSHIHTDCAGKHAAGSYTAKSVNKEQFLQRMINRHPRLYRIYRKIIVIFDKNHYGPG